MPCAEITFDEQALGITRDEILHRLYEGSPAISLAPAGKDGVFINPQTLQPGQEKFLVERLQEILNEIVTALPLYPE